MENRSKIIYLLAVLTLIISSCDRELESEGLSRITFFPEFTVPGESEMFVERGQPFTDPGATATEEGQPIEVSTSVSGTYFAAGVSTIDTDVPDKYTISYSAVNKDGFPGSVSRTVWVAGKGDLVNNIEGLYTMTVKRDGAGGAPYTNNKYAIIAKTGENTYELSDAIGGYYEFGRGYGPAYAAQGAVVTANDIPANNFSYGGTFGVGAFGGEAKITAFTVNPANKTIIFTTSWAADPETTYVFETTLTQVEF